MLQPRYYLKRKKSLKNTNNFVSMVCESLKACLPQYGYKKLEDEILLDDEYEIICIPSEYAELIIKCQVKYNPVGKIAKKLSERVRFC